MTSIAPRETRSVQTPYVSPLAIHEATIALAPVAGWAIKTPVTIVSSSAEALGPTDESSRPDSKALVLTKTVAWRRPQEGCTFAANPVR